MGVDIILIDMTNRERKLMIERWLTGISPKAILRAADARCGARYAVYVVATSGEFGTKCTDYLPLEQLEQYLLGVFHAYEFNQLILKSKQMNYE
jgi:hypothetical protein